MDDIKIDIVENNNDNNNKKKIIVNKKVVLLSLIALMISILVPITYAFFTAGVQGNTSASANVIQAGTMTLSLTDGNVIGTTSEWIPGTSLTKSFTVENTGTLPAAYSISLESVLNDFEVQNELVYEIVGTSNGTSSAYSTSSAQVAPGCDAKIIDNQSIASGDTHSYTLTLRFISKNETQDYNQGKTFRGKIQLYDVNNEPTFTSCSGGGTSGGSSIADTIADLVDDSTDLIEDETSAQNIRYVGANPSNYVYFNCSTTTASEMNDSTCEKWRIIGSFDDSSHGVANTNLVKIMRNTSIADAMWNVLDENDWPNADLNQFLNSDSGYYGRGNYTAQYYSMDATSYGIMEQQREYIQEVDFNIGGINYQYNIGGTNYSYTPVTLYNKERTAPGAYMAQNAITHTAKIGLPNASDFYLSSSGGTVGREACVNNAFFRNNNWNNSQNMGQCTANSWLTLLVRNSNTESYGAWLLNASDESEYWGFIIEKEGSSNSEIMNGAYISMEYQVYPTLYLNSSVNIVDGDGSSSNPYKLSM